MRSHKDHNRQNFYVKTCPESSCIVKVVDDDELTGITAQAQTFEIRTCRGRGNHRSKWKIDWSHDETKMGKVPKDSSRILKVSHRTPSTKTTNIQPTTMTTTLGPYCWFPKVFHIGTPGVSQQHGPHRAGVGSHQGLNWDRMSCAEQIGKSRE